MARIYSEAVDRRCIAVVCFWPTGDGLHPLNAHPKPDAQGATAKVSFAVLYSSVARPAIGQRLPSGAWLQMSGLGWSESFPTPASL